MAYGSRNKAVQFLTGVYDHVVTIMCMHLCSRPGGAAVGHQAVQRWAERRAGGNGRGLKGP